MLIVFSGLPGTGKSTLANEVALSQRAPVLSVDPVESAILRAGIARSFDTGLAAYLVAEAMADAQLSLGQSAIVDAVNGVEPAKDLWRRLAARHGAALRVIECVCSDEALHLGRLAARLPRYAPFPEPTWEQVERARREYTAWREPFLRVDETDPLEQNVACVLEWLRTPEP